MPTRVHEAPTRVHEAPTRVHEAPTRVHEATTRVPEPDRRVHETTTRGPRTTRRTPDMTQRTPDRSESTPTGPGRPDFGPSVPGPSRRRTFGSPRRSSDRSSHQGSKSPPARGVGTLAIRRTRTQRPRIANNETTNRTKTINFVLPLWIFFCFYFNKKSVED